MPPEKKWYYYLLALPFYGLALIPFPVLYGLSDGLWFLAYHVIGYRRKVVQQNLKNAFPHLSAKERRAIEKKYYRNMIDVFLETFKSLLMSEKEMKRRCAFSDMNMFENMHAKGLSTIILLGHMGNWEWGGFSFTYHSSHGTATLYHPLSNSFFEWLTYRLRSRCGMELIPMQTVARNLAAGKNRVRTVAFIADQSPQPNQAYWTSFMHQETGFFVGAEKLAVKYGMPVFYAGLHRIKRGYYEVRFVMMEDHPESAAPHSITQKFAEQLQADIIAYPEQWLWSHRRWKHKRPA
jgi:KDO2-lipid IV(A) lauroyltransferase